MRRILIILILVAVVFSTLSCSNTSTERSREKEVQALQLLGSTGEGYINTKCSKTETQAVSGIIKSQDAFYSLLKNKDFVRDFHETARKVADAAKNCGSDKSEASLLVEKSPAIAQIVNILGKEDSTEDSNFAVEVDGHRQPTRTIPVTLYRFGWLGFAVSNADNSVIGIVMDFTKFRG